jgi:fluoride ion exporter CrcB/FEX
VTGVLAALPTLATWSVEAAGLAHPSNSVRAIAALPLGFAAAWLVIGTLNGESGREDRRDRDLAAGPPP